MNPPWSTRLCEKINPDILFDIIKANSTVHNIDTMCKVLEYPRSTYCEMGLHGLIEIPTVSNPFLDDIVVLTIQTFDTLSMLHLKQ